MKIIAACLIFLDTRMQEGPVLVTMGGESAGSMAANYVTASKQRSPPIDDVCDEITLCLNPLFTSTVGV